MCAMLEVDCQRLCVPVNTRLARFNKKRVLRTALTTCENYNILHKQITGVFPLFCENVLGGLERYSACLQKIKGLNHR